jgi:hypothetical protein
MTFQVGKHVLLQAGARDFPHLQISCWGHPASYSMHTRDITLVNWPGHEVDHFYSPISPPEHQNKSKINIICWCGQQPTLVSH